MSKVRIPAILAACLLVLAFSDRSSASILVIADLTNRQAALIPPVPTTSTGDPRPASFGTGVFEVNDEMTAMTFTLTAFNIDFTGQQTADTNDNLTSAAIRIGLPFTNGAVAFGFFGEPFDDTDPNDMIFAPFTNAVGGVISGK
jgi:hypothetical protein